MHLQGAVRAHQPQGHRRAGGDQGGPAGARTDLANLLIRDKDALGLVASTYKESAAAQALFDRPGRLYTGHHNNLYKGLVQELKKLEMQDQDNSDAIDKLLERIGMFPNLPTGSTNWALTHTEPVLGKTEARTVWRNTFVAHKYCGRFIVKLRPTVPLSAPRSRSRRSFPFRMPFDFVARRGQCNHSRQLREPTSLSLVRWKEVLFHVGRGVHACSAQVTECGPLSAPWSRSRRYFCMPFGFVARRGQCKSLQAAT